MLAKDRIAPTGGLIRVTCPREVLIRGLLLRQSGTDERETIMALKIELKPDERIIIGESLITNSDIRTRFLIDGDAPILREKDILTAETADTPVKRIYLCVQMMYLEKDIAKYQADLFRPDQGSAGRGSEFQGADRGRQ